MRAVIWILPLVVSGQDISGSRIRAHVKFLASDALEGRGVGARGGALATEYLASQLAVAGARPAAASSYFQPVPLVNVRTLPESTLSAESGGRTVNFTWLSGFVGQALTQAPLEEIDADAIFAGHGISAPEYGWDDYAGAEVAGKVVILFTNEPQSEDPRLFEGRALTYYGRWTYKYEQALRHGARGVLILHTPQTAGYGWDVVRNSWGREEAHVKANGAALQLAGWLSGEAAEQMVALSGQTVAGLVARAGTRGFRAFPLGVRIRGRIHTAARGISANNVAGIVPGEPLAGEAVVFTAHWDHLGRTEGTGDTIFNGAVDNATGCAMLIEMARAWADLPRKPRRSALFLFTAAEESGLRGAEYYVKQPLVPLAKTALVLNFDSFHGAGRPRDAVLERSERTTFWPVIQTVAQRFQLAISPAARPEQGSFFRSDHFPFAKAGVAAFSLNGGRNFFGDESAVAARLSEYGAQRYHQPGDEYEDNWDFAGMEHLARFGMALGLEAANAESVQKWVEATPPPPVQKKRRR
ncbi:MAG: M20/M25/M40 family metallo-hydrolase [Acidobacteria bacterium]|nr:M20/M25/M40 family metallo-hydrolase [Acidobacteriota bacterium]